jgi:hypothetical protein
MAKKGVEYKRVYKRKEFYSNIGASKIILNV